MHPNYHESFEKLRRDGVVLYFNGPVTQGVVEGLAGLMRRKMTAEEVGMKTVHTVFSLLVEQLQNIVRYSDERPEISDPGCSGSGSSDNGSSDTCNSDVVGSGFGLVIVGRETDGRFYVACGNRIRTRDGAGLTRRLEKLRGMGKDDLKAWYKDRLRNEPDPDSKGAGLGFIEMARRATGPLDYSIMPVDAETSFFSLKVTA